MKDLLARRVRLALTTSRGDVSPGLAGSTEKARRFRLLLNAYGLEPDIGITHAGMEWVREGLEHLRKLVSDGS